MSNHFLCVAVVVCWHCWVHAFKRRRKWKEKEHLLYGRGTLQCCYCSSDISSKCATLSHCVSMKMISGKCSVWENRKRMSSIFHSFDKMSHIIHHKMMMMMMMRLKFHKMKECGKRMLWMEGGIWKHNQFMVWVSFSVGWLFERMLTPFMQ